MVILNFIFITVKYIFVLLIKGFSLFIAALVVGYLWIVSFLSFWRMFIFSVQVKEYLKKSWSIFGTLNEFNKASLTNIPNIVQQLMIQIQMTERGTRCCSLIICHEKSSLNVGPLRSWFMRQVSTRPKSRRPKTKPEKCSQSWTTTNVGKLYSWRKKPQCHGWKYKKAKIIQFSDSRPQSQSEDPFMFPYCLFSEKIWLHPTLLTFYHPLSCPWDPTSTLTFNRPLVLQYKKLQE